MGALDGYKTFLCCLAGLVIVGYAFYTQQMSPTEAIGAVAGIGGLASLRDAIAKK